MLNVNNTKMSISKFKKMTEKELEIFVRQRLGQKDAVLCEHGKLHRRLCFHTATPQELVNNAEIVALFSDIWEAHDHSHSPVIMGYKGTLQIGSTLGKDEKLFGEIYSGSGTVEVMCDLIWSFLTEKIYCWNGLIRQKIDKNQIKMTYN